MMKRSVCIFARMGFIFLIMFFSLGQGFRLSYQQATPTTRFLTRIQQDYRDSHSRVGLRTCLPFDKRSLVQRGKLERNCHMNLWGMLQSAKSINLAGAMQSADKVPPVAYFGYLMAAGVGVPVSEDALCIWVGTLLPKAQFTLSRKIKSVLYLYTGVVLSDMVTYSAGVAFRNGMLQPLRRIFMPKNTDGLSSTSPMARAEQTVRRAGRWAGTAERFALGLRGPVCLACGALGVPPGTFLAGVALGALGTLPLQLGAGYLLRSRPDAAAAIAAGAAAYYTLGPSLAAAGAAALALARRAAAARGGAAAGGGGGAACSPPWRPDAAVIATAECGEMRQEESKVTTFIADPLWGASSSSMEHKDEVSSGDDESIRKEERQNEEAAREEGR